MYYWLMHSFYRTSFQVHFVSWIFYFLVQCHEYFYLWNCLNQQTFIGIYFLLFSKTMYFISLLFHIVEHGSVLTPICRFRLLMTGSFPCRPETFLDFGLQHWFSWSWWDVFKLKYLYLGLKGTYMYKIKTGRVDLGCQQRQK